MAITIPNVFVAGTRIESAPVNANFAAMSNALDKTGDTLTGNLAVGTGITIDGLDISTVPQSGGVFNPSAITFTNIIIGAATTSGIRLDLESGTLAVREGDDSAYGPMLASVYNVPTGGSLNFNEGSAALAWDTTDSTATLALNANVSHRIGAQELVRVINRTGSAIAKGKAVYIVGSNGTRVDVALADASTEATAATTLGITAESIADGAEGFVCVTGLLRAVTTTGLTEGQIVWLSETAGDLTSTRPTQPAHGVFMGLCVKSAGAGGGILYVSVINGLELEELHDVLITTPAANQILKRNSGNTLWVNASGAALTKTDDTNVTLTLGGSASTALVNAASLTLGWTGQLALSRGGTGASTAQAAINALAGATTSGQYLRGDGSNVTLSAIQAGDVPILNQNTTGTAAGLSSTLAVSSGGTGQTSYTDGQLLIGNTATTSLSKATLTAGSGVTITNGNGTITIAASGSGGTVTGVTATSPVASSGGTAPVISLSSAYGDTLNPYGSKTANYVLAAPDGSSGTPSFRALLASDIPTLNQNTTGTAAGLSSTLAVSSGGTGQTSYTDGELLIGNSTGNTLTKATLTAGSGITITNAGGSITIASAGGAGSGTVTSVSGTGTANGLTLSGTVTTTGSLTLSGTVDSMSALAGSASAPSIAASGDTNTGIYFPAADEIAITTGGTERLRVGSGGNVGIGTSSSGYPLQVVGGNVGLTAYSDTTPMWLRIERYRGTSSAPTAVASGDHTGFIVFRAYGGTNMRNVAGILPSVTSFVSDTEMTTHMAFWVTNASSSYAERMRLTGSGNLAIGATARVVLDGTAGTGDTYITESSANVMGLVTGGTTALSLAATAATLGMAGSATVPALTTTGDSNTGIYFPTADTVAVTTGGTERLRVDSSGNVGIGTTSPGAALDIARDTTAIARTSRFSTDATGAFLTLRKARGTQASPTVIAVNDDIGNLSFTGYGGTTHRELVRLTATATRVVSDTDMGAELTIATCLSGTGAFPRMKFMDSGSVALQSSRWIWMDMNPSTGVVGAQAGLYELSGSISVWTGGASSFIVAGSGIGIPATRRIYLDGTALTGDTYITEAAANSMSLVVGGTTSLSLSSAGVRVGVVGSAGTPPFSVVGDPNTGIYFPAADIVAVATNGTERLRVDSSGNVGINVSTFGTSAAGVLALKNGTKPTTGPADTIQIYSVDRSAGNTIPAVYTEGTGVSDAGITNTTVTHKIAIEVNGTVYYLLATTNAT